MSLCFRHITAIFLALVPGHAVALARNSTQNNSYHLTAKQSLTIDLFQRGSTNELGHYHGPSEGLKHSYKAGRGVTLRPSSAEQRFSTQVASGDECADRRDWVDQDLLLHLEFAGPPDFSISLVENNVRCSSAASPYPDAWDSVEAARYAHDRYHIYVPLAHFRIDFGRLLAVSVHGFFGRTHRTPVRLRRLELVPAQPPKRKGLQVPDKRPTAQVALRCSRPNSFAFGIDDGSPALVQQMMDILEEEDVLVTFFAVGQALDDGQLPFSGVYRTMLERGHQIGLHSYSHPS